MNGRTILRRVLGGSFLALGAVLLIVGETLLEHRLGPVATFLYWGACLFCIFCAILCALADAMHSLVQSRRERHTLVEDTLREVDEERLRRKRPGSRPPESR